MPVQDLRAEGDRDAFERLLGEREVEEATERMARRGEPGARRQLLATATRLTPPMAPDLHALVDRQRRTVGLESPLELYVYPEPLFNAAAVRPERGRLLLLFSSGLLEAFAPPELSFVIGHELGHYLYDHHRIPVAALLGGGSAIGPALALRLFAWQRWAEISADRAGLVCAGGLEPSARALFALASGLSRGRVEVRIDQFLAQYGDLREEVDSQEESEPGARADWFATHPFSPLRLRAAEWFAGSELVIAGGTSRAVLEQEVQDLMTLMDPSYLQDRSEVAEAMRRLLFAGGVAVAAASGKLNEAAIAALERLLGPGSIPPGLRPDVVRADLASRIETVNRIVPVLRRAQVLRDLCIIARADGHVDETERQVILDLAAAAGVDPTLAVCAADVKSGACATHPASV